MKDMSRVSFAVFSAFFLTLAAPPVRADGAPDPASAARDGVLDALRTMGTKTYGCADVKRGTTVGLVHADSRGVHTIAEQEDEGAAMMFNFGEGPASFEGYLVEKVALDRIDPNFLVFSLKSTAGRARRTLWLNVANPTDSSYTVPVKKGHARVPLRCSLARPTPDGSWRMLDFEAAGSRTQARSDARSSERPFSERLRESMLRWDARTRERAAAEPAL
jgi:hypothetical protein